MIVIKSNSELAIMREAGRIVAGALAIVRDNVKPGITTKYLNQLVESFIERQNGTPAFKGYYGYPASICASINDQVVHGIPGDDVLQEGDILSVDIGVFYKGYCGDAAKTFPVGKISDEAQYLIDTTRDAFYEGLKFARTGYRLSDISHAIQSLAEDRGFSVVKDYVGHGIGKEMHEEPQVPNFGKPNRGPRLRPGMTLAIEPMINQGTDQVYVLDNNWTVVTRDHKLSAHYEHSVAITEDEPIILTRE